MSDWHYTKSEDFQLTDFSQTAFRSSLALNFKVHTLIVMHTFTLIPAAQVITRFCMLYPPNSTMAQWNEIPLMKEEVAWDDSAKSTHACSADFSRQVMVSFHNTIEELYAAWAMLSTIL